MLQAPENGLFSSLPRRRPPFGKFFLCMVGESLALVAIAWVGVLHPEALAQPIHDYHFIQLVSTPVAVNHEPAPVRYIDPPADAQIEHREAVLRVPALQKPKVSQEEISAPKVEIATAQPLTLPPAVPAVPRQLVKTNVFSTGNSDPPTIARAPQQVQTGSFGDPNGVPARENKGKPVTIASLGSFELPAGAGHGNGTAGVHGVAGVVASAGFGNGVATGDGSGRVNTSRGTVRQSGFVSADAMVPAPVPPKSAANSAAKFVPAEIVFKPAPVYTTEAKNLHIEGEVLLEAVFESTGKLRIVRVVQGLGHGLDESAVRAAGQIRFKPALRDGQPSDFTAIVHIVFQLA
jgi:TonB family protein